MIFFFFFFLKMVSLWCSMCLSAKLSPHTSEINMIYKSIWTTSSEFGTYRLCEQRRFRRACASAQYRQNLCCSLIQAVSQEESSDRKPDPWPLWMTGHTQLKVVMTECSKTQISLTRLISWCDCTLYGDINRGSYMNAHVLLNLLNKLGKKIRCEALPSILPVFPNLFN